MKLPKNKTFSAWFKARIREFNESQVQVQWAGDDEVHDVYDRRDLSFHNFRCFAKEYDDEDLPREMKEPWHENLEVLSISLEKCIVLLFCGPFAICFFSSPDPLLYVSCLLVLTWQSLCHGKGGDDDISIESISCTCAFSTCLCRSVHRATRFQLEATQGLLGLEADKSRTGVCEHHAFDVIKANTLDSVQDATGLVRPMVRRDFIMNILKATG